METHLSRNSLLFARNSDLLGDRFATDPFIDDITSDRSVNFAFFATQAEISASQDFSNFSSNQAIALIETNYLENANSILESTTSYVYEPLSLANFTRELPVEPFETSTDNLNFTKLYIFGDSLSDPGNLFNVTSFLQPFEPLLGVDIPVVPPSPPYFAGRFSNGLIWIDYLAEDLGITVTPSTELSVFNPLLPVPSPVTITEDGVEISPFFNGATTEQSVNFAFGGAQTGFVSTNPEGELIPGLLQQVEWFIDDHELVDASADPNALYVIEAGSNDYLFAENPNPEQSVENIETAITSLYELGARNFLVWNVPDLGDIPLALSGGTEVSQSLTDLSLAHNAELDEMLDELTDELTGINIIEFDIYSILNDVILNPEQFGFTNVTEPGLDPVTLIPVSNPDEYLFWDEVHPTTVAHEILAEFALDALTPQPDYVAGIMPEPVMTF